MNIEQIKCEVCNTPAKIVRAEENYSRCASPTEGCIVFATADFEYKLKKQLFGKVEL